MQKSSSLTEDRLIGLTGILTFDQSRILAVWISYDLQRVQLIASESKMLTELKDEGFA